MPTKTNIITISFLKKKRITSIILEVIFIFEELKIKNMNVIYII